MQTTPFTLARDISDSEWEGFAGATSWPARSLHGLATTRPLIREIGKFTLAIADATGIELYAKGVPEGAPWRWSIPLPRESARMFLNALTVETVDGPPEYLRQLGFEEV